MKTKKPITVISSVILAAIFSSSAYGQERRVVVDFNHVHLTGVHDDAGRWKEDYSMEMYFTISANGKSFRWPHHGERSMRRGDTAQIDKQLEFYLEDNQSLNISIKGWDHDYGHSGPDNMGIYSKKHRINKYVDRNYNGVAEGSSGSHEINYTISID